MPRCNFADSSPCALCGCDGTPGFKENCGEEPHKCESLWKENVAISVDHAQIFQITKKCAFHQNFEYEHFKTEIALKKAHKLAEYQVLKLSSQEWAQLVNCKICQEKLQNKTFHNYPK